AYLACINYTDTCVGVLLDALRKSKYAENTIVIFWGDHGWHLGEKLRYKKFTPWEEACRMPLVIKVPGMTKENSRCKVPVNLMDLYPTITELCGLPDNTNNEGESLLPLLINPNSNQNSISWTTQDGQSMRNDNFRYIRRTTGEELYDHRVDEMEWENLVENPLYTSAKTRMSYLADSLMFQLTSEPRTPIRRNKIPGVMQAEKFDRGGEGVGYHDSDATNKGGKLRKAEGVDIQASNDVGGGFSVSSTSADEWLAFTTDSIKPGKYFLQARIISSQSGGTIEAILNDKMISSISIPLSTTWKTISSDTLTLTYGNKADLRFRFSNSGFTVNYFEFVKVGELPTALPKLRNNTTIIYPNSTNGTLYLNVFEFDTDMTVSLITLTGKLLWKSGKISESVEIPVDPSWPDGVVLALIQGKNKSEVQKVIIRK
ncbi:sulfatase-like hydrolase/transferase, partial [bacterium]|nr:sulfatase-like hydrolase/transferase [bacterium]